MGLDVYLIHYKDDPEKWDRIEDEYNARADALWTEASAEKYEDIPESEREEIRARCKAVAAEMGLDQYGCTPDSIKQSIRISSGIDQSHLFQIGYLRSSYNEGGINSVLRNLGLPELADIFGVGRDEYIIKPDWQACLTRARSVLEQMVKANDEGRFLFCFTQRTIQMNNEPLSSSRQQAVDQYIKQAAKVNGGGSEWSAFSNMHGTFYTGKPFKIRALVSGYEECFTGGRRPVVYVVHEGDAVWYIKAMQITIEMIEHVIGHDDREMMRLHWSG